MCTEIPGIDCFQQHWKGEIGVTPGYRTAKKAKKIVTMYLACMKVYMYTCTVVLVKTYLAYRPLPTFEI